MRIPVALLTLHLCSAAAAVAQGGQQQQNAASYVTVQAPVIALTHVRIVDGTGAPAREDQTIILEAGRIVRFGPSASIAIPAGTHTVELRDHTVIPGLIGMHNHTYYTSAGREMEQPFSAPRLYLGAGVTTIRTIGSIDPYTELNLKKAIEAGATPGPRMFISGPYLSGGGTHIGRYHLTTAESARRVVDYWVGEGVRWFKAYTGITREQLRASVEEAHKQGVKLTGHICAVTFREAADIGIDNLEHGLLVATDFDPTKKPDECPRGGREYLAPLSVSGPELQGLISHLVSKNVAITSTLAVWETMVAKRPILDDRVLDAMYPQVRAEVSGRRDAIAQANDTLMAKLFRKEMDFEYAFAKAGGTLVAGIDPTGYGAAIPGYGDQRQVELLVEAGFTPVEAIQIATLNGAKLLGEADRIGSIAPGKAADLVVVRGNPAQRIMDIRNVVTVFKDGVGYDSVKLLDAVNGRLGLQ
jgi:imidazolonepropionase-like amidohydrolase